MKIGAGDFPLPLTSQPLRGSVLDVLLFLSAARNVIQAHASCEPGIRVAGAGSRHGGTMVQHGTGSTATNTKADAVLPAKAKSS